MGESNPQPLLPVARGIRTSRRLPHWRGPCLEFPRPEADSRSWTQGQMLRLHRAARGMPAVELGRLLGLWDVHIGAQLPAFVLSHGAHARRPPVGTPGIGVAPTRAVSSEAKPDRAVVNELTTSELSRLRTIGLKPR